MATINQTNLESQRSAGEIVQDVVRDLGNMVRSEIRLVKAEMAEKAGQAGRAAGMIGAAAVCGFLAAGSLVAAAIIGLALVMPLPAAAGAVGFVLLCLAGILFAMGKDKLRKTSAIPERTARTLKEMKEIVE